jgi:hypothetical protein
MTPVDVCERTIYIPHPTLLCRVSSIHYNFAQKAMTIWVAPGERPSMFGAISMGNAIDLGVQTIDVIAGDVPHMLYHRPNGKWEAKEQKPSLGAVSSVRHQSSHG